MERKPQLTQVAPVFPASHLDLPTKTTPLYPSNAVKETKHHSPAKNRPRGFSESFRTMRSLMTSQPSQPSNPEGKFNNEKAALYEGISTTKML